MGWCESGSWRGKFVGAALLLTILLSFPSLMPETLVALWLSVILVLNCEALFLYMFAIGTLTYQPFSSLDSSLEQMTK